MFNSNNDTRKKVVTPDGIVMTPCWTETLLNLEPGQSVTLDRHLLRPANVRSLVSRFNKRRADRRYAARTIGQDDAVEVTRVR